MGRLFGTDGVRGRANTYPITPEAALQLGKAVASVFHAQGHGSKRTVIGKDTRLSGYMLETALTSGLVSMGMDVYLVGPMPTPAVAHLTRSMRAAAGIMITASHNPADDNGIKLFNRQGFKLSDALEAEIEQLVLEGEITSRHIAFDQIGKAHRIDDARGRYVEFAKNSVDNVDLSGINLVVDCANGAGYFLAPIIFRELGARVVKLSTTPDGFNINRNCGALHPARLGEAVRNHGAHLGIALDGDGDRLVMCGPDGNVINGDILLGLLAIGQKQRQRLRNDQLVVTVMSNLGLHQAMAKRGIRTVVTPVGDRPVIEKMRACGANLGGEQSGHIIFMDHVTTGDGIISALQVLRLMTENDKGLLELAADIPLYPQRLTNIAVRERRPLETIPELQAVLAECGAALGDRGRHLIRYSGTENLCRILLEASEQHAVDHWSDRIADVVTATIGA